MIKIFSETQLRELENKALADGKTTIEHLVKRSSSNWAEEFMNFFPADVYPKVYLFCGPGNNGADGLATALTLINNKYDVQVVLLPAERRSQANSAMLERLKSAKPETVTETLPASLPGEAVVIDAIFGFGKKRPCEGMYLEAIKLINTSKVTVVALDTPSGLNIDSTDHNNVIVSADLTITYDAPKFSFMLAQNFPYVGEFKIVDSAIERKLINEFKPENYFLDKDDISMLIAKRPHLKFDHKGLWGTALLVAGSLGKYGAAVLAARGATNSGVGKLFVHVPLSGRDVLQVSVPEALLDLDDNSEVPSSLKDITEFDAIGIGPGIGTSALTRDLLAKLFTAGPKQLVLDADALNMLATDQELWRNLPENSILSPHFKEFSRLVTETVPDDYTRVQILRELAVAKKCVFILKGAHTAIALPDGKVVFNSSGCPGMAKAGMGDILNGVITALCAEGYPPRDAALIGVFVHGYAGELAATDKGLIGMNARNVADQIGYAFKWCGAE